jgi:hypothetical protein
MDEYAISDAIDKLQRLDSENFFYLNKQMGLKLESGVTKL